MVREISGFTLKKMSQKQLKDRIARLGKEYNKVIWDLETESGIGKNREYLIARKDALETEIERTKNFCRMR